LNCLNNICEPNRESCERGEWKKSTETQITWPRSEEESEAGEEDTKKVVKARGGESKKKSRGGVGCWGWYILWPVSCALAFPVLSTPRESESENTNKPKISCFLGTIWQAEQTEVETKQLVPNMMERGGVRERLS